jgi:hypothetical protein
MFTKLVTLPAAMRKPRGFPLNTSPLRNCAQVQTDATVVNSLTVIFLGADVPSTVRSAIESLAPLFTAAIGMPPLAITYKTLSAGAGLALSLKAPLASVCPWASCCGAPVLAA